jgi:hypothetical protein
MNMTEGVMYEGLLLLMYEGLLLLMPACVMCMYVI